MAARPTHPIHPNTPPTESFRRRFPLELTPEEHELLEREGRRAGTKRAALLAGLAALQEQEQLERAFKELEADRDRLTAALAEQKKHEAKLERQLAKAQNDAREGRAATRSAADTEHQARERADERADSYSRALDEERDANERLEAELDELRERAVDQLYCRRCRTWADPTDWAIHEDEKADVLYHEKCGFQRGTSLTESSILALRKI